MTRDEFVKVMSDDEIGGEKILEVGCNAVEGLKIIQKYVPSRGIEGAKHDVIYSVGIDDLLGANISREDAEELRALNWMIEDGEYMACFV